ncbi:hypothetical protein HanXRQr2_Chr12g0549151 [Helianthus annuus]|uniref:Uncharacterized protein n=1 Tax=Helianthus annuus TaxID=4232 RepID=A0A251SGF7_HELAN|nr:hypothetical protein HanXRQr2_Chr12g0549151 [Helianthus annuus]KAJ0494009.1 hypothetical protein HanIR_Chr12g0592541 [Helianthus annuus]
MGHIATTCSTKLTKIPLTLCHAIKLYEGKNGKMARFRLMPSVAKYRIQIHITRDELGIVWYRKNRYQKFPKVGTGTEYTRFGIGIGSISVRYRYLRVKTGKHWYRTGTENVKSRYRIGTKKVPGPVIRYRN